MPDLILDTSGDTLLLALFEKEHLLAEKTVAHEGELSALLLPTLQDLLTRNSLALKDLSSIFVGVGPGSYTGVRIGVATASSLALALELPLYSFCSLLAFPPPLPEGAFNLLLKAKHTNYLIEGKAEKGVLLEALPGKTTDLSPKEALFPQKEPNLPPLIPYLFQMKKSRASPPSIIYLHNF